MAKRHVKHHHQTSSGMGLSKARSRETIGGLKVDRLERTQLDYGKRVRLGSGQLDDGRERLESGQLDDGRGRLNSGQLDDGRERLNSGQLDDGRERLNSG